ncbi:hypothetical protein Patl1_05660 [Pistacia atlantica]|uniref:Uncharacterized protein n=1 Tax=Pistacia atlantica TaxID=434234 RepID=A0ACC1BPD4_9ROSI|nr:hypothetical protein Patl1_05660 [Pistacia atlantica]
MKVKRYIDVYSASSVIGFSRDDLLHISDLYAQAEKNRSCCSKKLLSNRDEICNSLLPYLKRQIDAYSNFLLSVANLARCKWTEFNLEMMGIVEEGKVANFLLATTVIFKFRYSIKRGKMLVEVGNFVSFLDHCSTIYNRSWAIKAGCEFSVYERPFLVDA